MTNKLRKASWKLITTTPPASTYDKGCDDSQTIHYQYSKLISDCNPPVSQIISTPKNLQIVSIWHQSLHYFINSGWLLTLPFSIAENYIAALVWNVILQISLHSHNTCLFGVLEVKSMALSDVCLGCPLHPCDCIHNSISPVFLHHVDGPLKFCINYPDEKKAFRL